MGAFSSAKAEFKVPSLTGPVVDQVGLLNPQDRDAIEDTLHLYHERGRGQIQILIVPTLDETPIENATIQVFDTWKLGEKGKDNAVLFFVAFNDHKMRIEVGRGFEGVLPDVIAKRIISDQVTPLFRAKRYSQGVVVGVSEILSHVDEEFAASAPLEPSSRPREKDTSAAFGWIVFLILFILFRTMAGGRRRSGLGAAFWFLGGGGGGGFGGGGGGGWSGGGGGSAGGGASGDW